MADRGHHGEGEHDQRDMTVPTVPGAGLVVVEAEFILRRLETILNCPAVTFYGYQRFDGRCGRAPCGEKGEITIGNITPDQQTPRPQSGERAVVFLRALL